MSASRIGCEAIDRGAQWRRIPQQGRLMFESALPWRWCGAESLHSRVPVDVALAEAVETIWPRSNSSCDGAPGADI